MYRGFLKEQVNEFVEETGVAAIIAKPKGGSGFLFYTSPSIQNTFSSKGTDNIALQYTLPRIQASVISNVTEDLPLFID